MKDEKLIESLEGLNLFDAYIFERMFEAFADLRELASYNKKAMPSLEETLDCAIKHSFQSKNLSPSRDVLIARFRAVLADEKIPEGRPNRYSYRRRLRRICCFLNDVLLDVRRKLRCSEDYVLSFKHKRESEFKVKLKIQRAFSPKMSETRPG
ncbi:hypothetical protein NIES22_71220 (plasmid) [Calothrix brevissima NIES-22]|nr:hypothetical protein NIES22_71220 [Calothrix brevissima NIES-22]